MKTQTLQRVVIGGCVWAVSQALSLPAFAPQSHDDGIKFNVSAPKFAATTVNPVALTTEANTPKRADAVVNLKKMETSKITSFFVRTNGDKRIQFSMRVAYEAELTEIIQRYLARK